MQERRHSGSCRSSNALLNEPANALESRFPKFNERVVFQLLQARQQRVVVKACNAADVVAGAG